MSTIWDGVPSTELTRARRRQGSRSRAASNRAESAASATALAAGDPTASSPRARPTGPIHFREAVRRHQTAQGE